jgi:glycosyltransferase involved in cell wall biosynthesis
VKRLAFFTENLAGGGVEKILQIVLKYWDYNQYKVTLYSLRDERDLFNQLFPNTIDYHYIFDYPKSNDGLVNHLLKKIKNKIKLLFYYHLPPSYFYRLFIRYNYDIGIAFIEGYATRIVSGASSRTKKIAWLHMELQRNHWTDVAFRSRNEEKKCYGSFQQIVCVSKEVKRQLDELYAYVDKTVVIYNPIDIENIIKQSEQPIKETKTYTANQLILTIGRLEKVKGHARLLKIVSRLQQEGYMFELWILGNGTEYDDLNRMISQLHIEQFVRLLGYKDNPYMYLNICDFYVCSSFAEGYNTTITEALILGKPVVSTLCSGVKEQLGDSEYGIVTENDENALYEGLCKMLNPETIHHYSLMAQKRKSLFNLKKQMEEIYQLIE